MGFFSKSGLGGIVGGALGAVIGGPAGAGLGYGLGSSLGSYSDERSAVKDAYNRNISLWNMNNAYNTPKEQMKRLREAGLNPNLVYGSGSVTGLASTMAHKAEKQGIGRVGDISDFERAQGIMNMQRQNSLLQYQADYASAQADLEREKLDILKRTGMLPGTSMAAGPLDKLLDLLFSKDDKGDKRDKKSFVDVFRAGARDTAMKRASKRVRKEYTNAEKGEALRYLLHL